MNKMPTDICLQPSFNNSYQLVFDGPEVGARCDQGKKHEKLKIPGFRISWTINLKTKNW